MKRPLLAAGTASCLLFATACTPIIIGPPPASPPTSAPTTVSVPTVTTPPAPTPTVPTTITTTATTTTTPPTTPPALSGVLGAPAPVVTDLDVPWGTDFLPSGEALVAERDSARVVRVPAAGGPAVPVVTLPDVVPSGEGGLLGLAVSPDYAVDGWVYVYATTAEDNRILRFKLDPAGLEPVDLQVVFSGITKYDIHNGGRIAFGPDGNLYVGTGDAGDETSSQNPADLNGKILRITPTGDVPADNPFPDSAVYSLGHRNVQGLAFDSTGVLYATELGQNTTDEVNVIQAGGNYGWPVVEGTSATPDARFIAPVATWPTSEASPSGAAIISGTGGDVLYVAAMRGQRLWRIPLGGDVLMPEALYQETYGRIRTVTAAPDGSLWMSTTNRDGRGRVLPGDDRILRLPPA